MTMKITLLFVAFVFVWEIGSAPVKDKIKSHDWSW